MSMQTFPKTHSWRRLRRRAERVRQPYENKSTPRARWINTGQPCWGLPAHQLQQLFLQIPLNLQTSTTLKNARTLKRCKHICSVDTLICGVNHRRTTWAQAGKQSNTDILCQPLTIIWISHLHTCRSCSLLTYILFRAQRTPWFVRTRNTIANPPAGLEKRDQIEALQTSRRWQTRHQNQTVEIVGHNPACTLQDIRLFCKTAALHPLANCKRAS